jgi:hypothetical protein
MTTTTHPAHLDHLTEIAARAFAAAAAADAAVCDERCIDAIGDECHCSCGGVNHGLRRLAAGTAVYHRRLATVGGDAFALLPQAPEDVPVVRRVVVVDEDAW